jgi:hypothetical protein
MGMPRVVSSSGTEVTLLDKNCLYIGSGDAPSSNEKRLRAKHPRGTVTAHF